jgi:hypothetical protein
MNEREEYEADPQSWVRDNTVDGIRPHIPLTPEQDDLARRTAENYRPGSNGCPFCLTSGNPDLGDHIRNVHPMDFSMWSDRDEGFSG